MFKFFFVFAAFYLFIQIKKANICRKYKKINISPILVEVFCQRYLTFEEEANFPPNS